MDPLKPMDFARAVSKKKLSDSGIEVGDIVLVVGLKPGPQKKNDPYTQRIYALVVKVEDNRILLPNEDNEHKTILVDPRHFEKLDKDGQDEYNLIIQKQFGNGNAPSN